MMCFCRLALTVVALKLGTALAAEEEETCSDLSLLGQVGWERYGGKVDITVDEDCMYTWKAIFKHDESLPIPDDPATQCDPSADAPELAADGLPYFAFRWHYVEVPDYFQAATRVNHLSLDFNPCGHPPVDVFTAPHYDMHTYRVSPAKRTCMLCTTLGPASPICDYMNPQETESGQAFFAPISDDFPASFVNFETDAVIHMGGHAYDPAKQPASAAEWIEPVIVMGAYNGSNIFYEPMPPLSFVSGDVDHFWEEDIVYANQKTENLATYSSVEYNATTGYTTMSFKGKSSICKEEFDALKDPPGDVSGASRSISKAVMTTLMMLGGAAAVGLQFT